jgi:multidrug efflux system outer membrane protein
VAGLSAYLEVLQAQQQLFPAEIQLAQARYNRLATLVELYRTLGGGWNLSDPQWTARP